MPERVQSIERSIDILLSLADGAKTVTEVARATELSKPTAYRLLGSLRYRNLVAKDDTSNRYMLGPGWLTMLNVDGAGFQSIGILGRGPLEELTKRTGETSVLHTRLGRERVCVAVAASPNAVRYSISAGSVAPLHVGSSGKVLLAYATDGEKLLDDLALDALTDHTVTSREQLADQLTEIRADGYAVSVGERTPGAAGVTVPVHGPHDFLASLSVIGPAERFSEQRVRGFLDDLSVGARTLEGILARA